MWKLDVAETLGRDEIAAAYQLYETAFTGINRQAVQRHLMTPAEFGAVCVDPDVEKWRVFDAVTGELVGLATYSNQLAAMSLISPEWYEAHYPEHFAAGRIWYCGFVCVPQHQTGAFVELIGAMYSKAADEGGIISLDYCQANDRLAKAVRAILQRIAAGRGQAGGYNARCVDAQSFWVYETAAATAPRPRMSPEARPAREVSPQP